MSIDYSIIDSLHKKGSFFCEKLYCGSINAFKLLNDLHNFQQPIQSYIEKVRMSKAILYKFPNHKMTFLHKKFIAETIFSILYS